MATIPVNNKQRNHLSLDQDTKKQTAYSNGTISFPNASLFPYGQSSDLNWRGGGGGGLLKILNPQWLILRPRLSNQVKRTELKFRRTVLPM